MSDHERNLLAERIKQLVKSKRRHLLKTDPLTVKPIWRVTISISDSESDKLKSLPRLRF